MLGREPRLVLGREPRTAAIIGWEQVTAPILTHTSIMPILALWASRGRAL